MIKTGKYKVCDYCGCTCGNGSLSSTDLGLNQYDFCCKECYAICNNKKYAKDNEFSNSVLFAFLLGNNFSDKNE